MPSNLLADFLAELAADSDMLDSFNSSEQQARALMNEAGLSNEEQAAVLSHNITAIHHALQPTGNWTAAFAVPAGPVKAPPLPLPTKKFEVIPEGSQESTGARVAQPTRTKSSRTSATRSRKATARGSGKSKSKKSKSTARKTTTRKGTRKSAKKGR
jgi:hypothetical protein